MSDKPWIKFYPADWRSDPRLRMCSLGARGLWMEMLALMHEASPYGYLLVSGVAPTDAQLAVLAGAQSDQIPELLAELETAGVFSRTKEGVIYSRRMVRDEKKARLARKMGTIGGNPKLKGEYRKAGFVYLMGVRSDGSYKIGVSVNPKNRLKKVRAQYPKDDIRVLEQWYVEEMGVMEALLHRTFSEKGDGEWFSLTKQDIEIIPEILDPKGSGKGPSLPQRPEARSQSEKTYLFAGRVIRLTERDHAAWRAECPNLDEAAFRRELIKCDAYLADNSEGAGKWFFRAKRWMLTADERAAEEKAKAAALTRPRWNAPTAKEVMRARAAGEVLQ